MQIPGASFRPLTLEFLMVVGPRNQYLSKFSRLFLNSLIFEKTSLSQEIKKLLLKELGECPSELKKVLY